MPIEKSADVEAFGIRKTLDLGFDEALRPLAAEVRQKLQRVVEALGTDR